MPQSKIPNSTATTSPSDVAATAFPRGHRYDPWEHAAALGIRVIQRPLTNVHELWLPTMRLIVLKASMRPGNLRVALAHGVAHAALGHFDDRPKHEQQADRYAAWHLIDPAELRRASAWARDAGQLAAELGVTRRMLLAHLSSPGWAGPQPAAAA